MAENLLRFSSTDVLPLPGASIVTTAPGSVTVAVSGEVDTFGSPVLEAAMEAAPFASSVTNTRPGLVAEHVADTGEL